MKLRVISLLLALALLLPMIPSTANASVEESAEDAIFQKHLQIQEQIRQTYNTARHRSGWGTFQGYCATWVTWQIYLLGLDSVRRVLDGNMIYDYYCRMDTTPTGYNVVAYPGWQYTIEQVLMELTDGGTRDAYNIMIGIERTPSPDGQLYGHALLIHAIIDGMVHFTESAPANIGGIHYPEGCPIMCTMEDFLAAHSDAWVTLDGIIYFGQKTYSDQCEEYTTDLTAIAKKDLTMYSEPCEPHVDESSYKIGTVHIGETAQILRIYRDPQGQFWYECSVRGRIGCVRAEDLSVINFRHEGLYVTGLEGFTTFCKGAYYYPYGTVFAGRNRLSQIRVVICGAEDDTPIYQFIDQPNARVFNIGDWKVWNELDTYLLDYGTYRIQVYVTVDSAYVEGGELKSQQAEYRLWNGLFEVTDNWLAYPIVTFDGNGGQAGVNQMVSYYGRTLGNLPWAVRPGYTFEGWYTQPEGGEKVTGDYTVGGYMTLYAQWSVNTAGTQGWTETDNGWRYYKDGAPFTGWLEYDGISFYMDEQGNPAEGWAYIDHTLYYFYPEGTPVSGWVTMDEDRYYFEDGVGIEGWQIVEGKTYLFNEMGKMVTGWIEEEGHRRYILSDGSLATSWQWIEGRQYLFDSDGNLVIARSANGQTISLP